MAGSRLEKWGTIYTRMTGLIKSGARKERPVWYEVYEAFPPLAEPNMFRPVPQQKIRKILYKEDIIRAKFYQEFGSTGVIDLAKNHKSLSQRFIEKYQELEKTKPNTNTDDLFKATEEALIKDGVTLRPKTQEPALAVNEVVVDLAQKEQFGKELDKESLKF